MSFFGKAREAAAMEYGRVRAERYGRIARFMQVIKLVAIAAAIITIIVVARS